MQRLITDLLVFSRVGTGRRLRATDLNACFATPEQPASQHHGGRREGHQRPLPTLPVDAAQIAQLFQNLIGNAIKFHSDQTPNPCRRAQGGGRWLFSVRDNGIGIEPQYFERIFQIFQRLHTRKEYPGTGIGLAICKRIVERHGGEIWVESQPGQGSTFYFSIPEIR